MNFVGLDWTSAGDRVLCGFITAQRSMSLVFLSSTPTMKTKDDTDDYCTKPFDANPDVSGIGVSAQLKSIEPGHFGNTLLPDSRCVLRPGDAQLLFLHRDRYSLVFLPP